MNPSILLILLLSLLSSACGSAAPPPPEEIVARAVARMNAVAGFRFTIDRSGGPAYLDPEQIISFSRADGAYTAPDRARATVRVVLPGLIAEVSMVAIGERYWETNLITRTWVELPADQAFNPASLFDPQKGLQPILLADLSELAFIGLTELEEIPGQALYQISGRLATTNLYPLSFGLIGPEPASVQLWIHPESFETYRILITEPAASAGVEPSVWQVDFWDFGMTEAIDPP